MGTFSQLERQEEQEGGKGTVLVTNRNEFKICFSNKGQVAEGDDLHQTIE